MRETRPKKALFEILDRHTAGMTAEEMSQSSDPFVRLYARLIREDHWPEDSGETENSPGPSNVVVLDDFRKEK